MKVCLVIPTLAYGGAERVISILANKWAVDGCEVHILLLASDERAYEIEESVIVHEIGGMNSSGVPDWVKALGLVFKIRSVLKGINPDFVLGFLYKTCVLLILSMLFSGVKVIVSDRNNPKRSLGMPLTSFLRKRLYKYAFGVIAQTEVAKNIIVSETGNKNVEVIYNPIDVKTSKSFDKENIILNVGRLHDQKGQSDLLRAFSNIEAKDWRLVILGDGPLRAKLENEAIKLGISSKVTFVGNVKNVEEWLCKSSIFALTSYYEGFPNALAEALISGLPCVSYDCDTGPAELIEHCENGVLVPLGDVAAFTNELDVLINSKERRDYYSKNSALLTDKLSVEKISSKYLRFCSND